MLGLGERRRERESGSAPRLLMVRRQNARRWGGRGESAVGAPLLL